MVTVVDGLVFDLDNTLFDREATFQRVADRFYEEHLSATTSVSREDAMAKIIRWDCDGYGNKGKMFESWVKEWPEAGLQLGDLRAWYRSEMDRQVQPDLEVNEFLAQLNEQQVPWGIVTNGSRNQHRKCQVAGLDQLASFTIVSEEAGYAKPDGRIFRDALKAIGLASPEQIMFIGDNPVADIVGAKRFGMKAAWIHRGRQYPANLQPPDHILHFVPELRHIVELTPRPASA